MGESVSNAVCVILCLVGFFSVLWQLICRLLCKRDCDNIITVIIDSNSSELPDKVYSALLLSKYRPLGKRDIYVVDKNVPQHIKILCETCVGSFGKVHFVSPEDVFNIFQNKD